MVVKCDIDNCEERLYGRMSVFLCKKHMRQILRKSKNNKVDLRKEIDEIFEGGSK
jgi:hypothetical protein